MVTTHGLSFLHYQEVTFIASQVDNKSTAWAIRVEVESLALRVQLKRLAPEFHLDLIALHA